MPLTDQDLISKFKLKPSDRILDIGGGSKQHDQINIHTLVDILPPEKAPYTYASKLKARHFVQLNIETDPLPFSDNHFDFVLCTHTLEDLHSPLHIIKEMSRVGKKGYIATPSRGIDMVFTDFDITNWLTGARRVPGLAHHKWFFENKKGVLHLTPKNYPLLYSPEFQYINWSGPEECQYSWQKQINIKYDPKLDIDIHLLIKNYRRFISQNQNHMRKATTNIFIDDPITIAKAYLKLLLKRGVGFRQ